MIDRLEARRYARKYADDLGIPLPLVVVRALPARQCARFVADFAASPPERGRIEISETLPEHKLEGTVAHECRHAYQVRHALYLGDTRAMEADAEAYEYRCTRQLPDVPSWNYPKEYL